MTRDHVWQMRWLGRSWTSRKTERDLREDYSLTCEQLGTILLLELGRSYTTPNGTTWRRVR